jgi:alpha-L-fucosidase
MLYFSNLIFIFFKISQMKYLLYIVFIFCFTPVFAQQSIPNNRLPSKAQLAWHDMEYYWFTHFGPNTFTGKEWGHGDEKEAVFNPSQLDCRQWCRVAKAAGAKGIIITAKHHDGFCLWPSKFSTHTIRESKWRNGKGDVLKELSQACKEYGLKFGVYLSPWDRNHPDYGTEKYNDVFVNMMQEIFTNYGPIWEFWWDGANGEGPNGKKQVYDFRRFENYIKRISPQTVVFSDIGPHCRWVGNENGIAGITNWNYLDTAGFKRGEGSPSTDTLNVGNRFGKSWIPAECDVSIRPGWFYHKEEDGKVKTPASLFQLYLQSVGRGANLLLNVPPDERGLINENDAASAIAFNKLLHKNFAKNIFKNAASYYLQRGLLKKAVALTDGNVSTAQLIEGSEMYPAGVELQANQKVNCIVLKEQLNNGQHCVQFKLMLFNKADQLVKIIDGTTIGRKRILTFPAVEINTIELTILQQDGVTAVSEIEAYLIDENLIEHK